MNGKEIKVVDYNLTYGPGARTVNVYGVFKCKKNNSLYIIYSDVKNTYNIIYYGISHIKETSILAIETKNKQDEEIVKEFIYKLTNEEELTDYEIIPLDKIEGIELISSNSLEIKPETAKKLEELTIPKKEENEEKKEKPKKKKSPKVLLTLLFLIILGIAGYYIYTNYLNKEQIIKQIICTKTYKQKELKVDVDEEKTFNFNLNDTLEKTEIKKEYIFKSETEYYDFINSGTYYKYMPEDNTEGGWDKNDEDKIYKTIEIERVNEEYEEPIDYEEVLSYYQRDGYTCEEKVMK